MGPNPYSNHDDFNITPPQHAGEIPVPRSLWPTVIGTVGIIYAVLMGTCSVCGLFTPQMYSWFASLEAKDGNQDVTLEVAARVAQQYQIHLVGLYALAILGLAILLIASIALIRRRAWSRTGLFVWSVIELFLTAASIGLQWAMAQTADQILTVEATAAEAQEAWLQAIVGAVVTGFISIILPIFNLIWFMRSKIKLETASWP
jgi:hypothetical protein